MFALNSRMKCCAVTKSCPTLCDHMYCSMRGFPVLHHIQELLRFMSIESVMLSNCLILCRHFLLSPSVLPRIRVFSSESALHITWPNYWCCSFSISPSNKYSGLISFRFEWFNLLAVARDAQESSPELQFKSINSLVLSPFYGPTLTSVHDY